MAANPRNRRRSPKQERSRTTVEAIVEAATQIFEAHGPDQATTNRIAERAGVSIGTLYQYFPNKDALFAEIARRMIEDLGAAAEQSLRGLTEGPLEQVVPQFMFALGELHGSSPRLRSYLFQLPGSMALMMAFNERLEHVLAEVLAVRSDCAHLDPLLAAQMLVRAVDGVLRDTTLREPERVRDPVLLAELSTLVSRYLTGG